MAKLEVPAFLEHPWNRFGEFGDEFAQAVDELAAPTVVIPNALFYYSNQLANVINLPVESVRLVITLFIAFALSFIPKYIHSPYMKSLFNLILGVLLSQYAFESSWVYLFVIAVGSYVLLSVCYLTGGPLLRYSPQIMLATLVGILFVRHLYKLHSSYLVWLVDFTGSLMLFVVKVSTLAYNMYDGTYAKKQLEKSAENPSIPEGRVAVQRLERSVPAPPSFLHFMGWMMCFSSVFAGPAFEYYEYARVVCPGTVYNKKSSEATEDQPGRIKAGFQKLGLGIVMLALTAKFQGVFNAEALFSEELRMPNAKLPSWAPTQAQFSVIWLAFFLVCMFFARAKYYAAWLVAEASANIAGFGYRQDKKDWEGVSNVDVFGFEFSDSVNQRVLLWNKQTQKWLAHQCAYRIPRSYGKVVMLLAVYGLSSIWHGAYPGYYLSFFTMPIVQIAEPEFNKKITARVNKALGVGEDNRSSLQRVLHLIWTVACTISASFLIGYVMFPFAAFTWARSMYFWNSVYFVGHWVPLCAIPILKLIPSPKSPSKKVD